MLQVAATPLKNNDNGKQKRALRKLLRDLVAFTGTAISELEAAPRSKAPPRVVHQRLFYRRAETLTDGEIDRIVETTGVPRVWRALDRLTQPQFPLAAE
jgi:hypothetical protein